MHDSTYHSQQRASGHQTGATPHRTLPKYTYRTHLLNSKTECLLQISSSSGGPRLDAGIELPYDFCRLDGLTLSSPPPPASSWDPPSLGEPSASPRGLRRPHKRVELRRRRRPAEQQPQLAAGLVVCSPASSLLAKQVSSVLLPPPAQPAGGLVEWSRERAGEEGKSRPREYNAVGGRVWRAATSSCAAGGSRADPKEEVQLRGDKPSRGAQLRWERVIFSARTAGAAGGAAMNAVGMAKAVLVGVSMIPTKRRHKTRW